LDSSVQGELITTDEQLTILKGEHYTNEDSSITATFTISAEIEALYVAPLMGVLCGQLATYSPLKGKYLADSQYSSPYSGATWKKSI
jgi:hypothetical protein